ncbi:aminotransferase class IV [Facklamia sp. P13064]|uniref:aminotransferase class IV n=1 Tax=Facklamia sp. P13064 TaxID=3421953 RepID=UPI003D16BF05
MAYIKLDEGFLFGQGVFTTLKVINGQALFLDQHLSRLCQSAKALGFKSSITKNVIVNSINEKEMVDGALKIILSPGNLVLQERSDPYGKRFLPAKPLKLAKWQRHSSNTLLQHKSTMYLANKINLKQIREKRAFECIFLNEKDQITEGSFTNLFFVKDQELITAPTSAGLLPGIMRQWVLDHFPVTIRPIDWQERQTFQAGFMTNCLMGITPIKTLESTHYQDHHPLIDYIQEEYSIKIYKQKASQW